MNILDFVSGTISGWAVVAVGQPLDFVKVKIQTAKQASFSELQIIKDIYKTYGLKGFYRGSSSMLFGSSFIGGAEFLVYEWAKRMLHRRHAGEGEEMKVYDPAKLSLAEVGLAGGIAGAGVSFIYCPIEYAKIQKQLSPDRRHSSLGLLFRELFHNGFSNVYRGVLTTIVREFGGAIFYFGAYETIIRAFTGEHRENATSWMFLTAGALAGPCHSLFTYPVDSVKSNIQAGYTLADSIRNSMKLSKMRGYKVVLSRSLLVSASSFWVYQTVQRLVSGASQHQ